jgi:hypothetical protein
MPSICAGGRLFSSQSGCHNQSSPVYSGLLIWIKVGEIGQDANVGMGRRQLDWLEIAGYASIVLAALAAAIILASAD